MNLSELATVVSKKTGLEKPEALSFIKKTLNIIATEVKMGGRVSIIGFGAFYRSSRKGRIGRNPKTGEQVQIKSKDVPRFKAGKRFKEAVIKEAEKQSKKRK